MKQTYLFPARVVAVCACILTVAACSSKTTNQETASETLHLNRTATLMPNYDPQVNPRALSRTEAGWRFASGQQWAYGAFAPFDGFGSPAVKGIVEVELQVASGRMAIGLLTDRNEILQEKFVEATPASHKLTFTLGSANLESVVFRSAAPPGTVSEAVIQIVDYVLQVSQLVGTVSVQQVVKVDPSAGLDPGPPLRVSTEQKWGYAARIPLTLPPLGNSMAFVRLRGRVTRGRMGVGILDKSGRMANERFYDPAPTELSYFVLIDNPDNAGAVTFRSDKDENSEIVVEDVSVFRLM